METQRIDLLNKLAFSWNPKQEKKSTNFNKLEEFRECNPNRWPNNHSKDLKEKQLAAFCQRLRQNYKKGILDKNLIERLKYMGFEWKGQNR